MLEYLAYKKFKKNRDQKVKARQDDNGPVLTDDDELFLERLTSDGAYSDEAGHRPPLPPRLKTPDVAWDDDSASDDSKGAAHSSKTAKNSPSGVKRTFSLWVRNHAPSSLSPGNNNNASLAPTAPITEEEAQREKTDMNRVLDDLNLAARNNKTFALSRESTEMVGRFTVVLKDLVNGVPTAAADLRHLVEDHDGTLARNYEKLPSGLKKMVTGLPAKLTGSLAPELLAVAAESQGLKASTQEGGGGLKDQAMKLVMPKNLSELVTKPSAIVGMLKAIMNALKLRWPAFIGTNMIWSIGLTLLLFVLWYCHKRGREVRLEREKSEAADMSGRVEELSDTDSAIGSVSTPLVIEPARTPARIEAA